MDAIGASFVRITTYAAGWNAGRESLVYEENDE